MSKPKPAGRPTGYKPEYCDLSRRLGMLGLTGDDLAKALGVSPRTIDSWKSKHPEFKAAIEEGGVHADARVVGSLFERACGYSHPETKILVVAGEVVREHVTKHYPPDAVAGIFWLKNRQPKYWRDQVKVGLDDEGSGNIQVTISRAVG